MESGAWQRRTRRLVEGWQSRLSGRGFCSVYDDGWRAELDGGEPTVVGAGP